VVELELVVVVVVVGGGGGGMCGTRVHPREIEQGGSESNPMLQQLS
jgi:hypothetical protein